MRHGRESWILAVLLLVFVAATTYYAERGFQRQRTAQPTTYSVAPGGLKALYQLFQREGLRVERFERSFTHLPQDAGLLVMTEPLARGLQKGEEAALWRWVMNGGALLLVVSAEWKERVKQGFTPSGVEVRAGGAMPGDLPVEATAGPFLRDVRRLHVAGVTRLVNRDRDHQTTLAADDQGAYAVVWDYENGGSILVVTDGLTATNEQLARADNAVFFVNAALHHTRRRRVVLFDEFHQGFGAEEGTGRTLWQAVGAPVRAVVWYLLAVLLLALYNANRRFGTARRLATLETRPSTEYIASMAGLFRRAGAAEIALETLYHAFARDLAARVDAPPGASPDRVAELSARRFGWDADTLKGLMQRCEKIASGGKSTENEVNHLAVQIQEYRRKADLARLS